jgi:hypothetical protein
VSRRGAFSHFVDEYVCSCLTRVGILPVVGLTVFARVWNVAYFRDCPLGFRG